MPSALNEIIHTKGLAQCRVHRKCSVNISHYWINKRWLSFSPVWSQWLFNATKQLPHPNYSSQAAAPPSGWQGQEMHLSNCKSHLSSSESSHIDKVRVYTVLYMCLDGLKSKEGNRIKVKSRTSWHRSPNWQVEVLRDRSFQNKG